MCTDDLALISGDQCLFDTHDNIVISSYHCNV